MGKTCITATIPVCYLLSVVYFAGVELQVNTKKYFKLVILTWIDKMKENKEMCGKKEPLAAVCI